MAYITKDQVRQAIAGGAQRGFSPEDVVNEMVLQGHQLEDYNAPAKRIEGAFPAEVTVGEESIGKQTMKQIYNAGNELFRMGKQIVTDPGGTAGGIVKLGSGLLQEALLPPDINIPNFHSDGTVTYDPTEERMMARQVGQKIFHDYGGEDLLRGDIVGAGKELAKTMFETPLSVAADIMAVGVGGKVAKTGKLPSVDLPKLPTGGVGTVGKAIGKEAFSKSTGLNLETAKTILKKPEMYARAEAGEITKGAIAHKVKSSIDTRLKAISEAGAEYDVIRKAKTPVVIPDDTINKVMGKYGIKVNFPEGTLKLTSESRPLSAGDIKGLEEFMGTYGSYKRLTSNGFLNAREALSKLSEFDVARSDLGNQIARDLRSAYNEIGRPQLKGLADIDSKYAPEISFLRDIKKEYLKTVVNEDGARVTVLKDNALSKIMNASNSGREQILARLERLDPGIGDEIRVLKALEDVQLAGQNKIGTYFRGGMALTGLSMGNIPLIAAAVISSPQIVAKILTWYGKKIGRAGAEDVMLKMQRGAKLLPEEKGFVQGAFSEYESAIGENRLTPLSPEQPSIVGEQRLAGLKGDGGGFQKNSAATSPIVKTEDFIPTTGSPFEFSYVRNTEKAGKLGSRFGQDVEPSGKYMTVGEPANGINNLETGTMKFNNPLVIDFGEGYGDAGNWKNVLSKQYGGKTGKDLSAAIKNDGYDGIVTISKARGKQYTSEIVSLNSPKSPTPAIPKELEGLAAEARNVMVPVEVAPEGGMGGMPFAERKYRGLTTKTELQPAETLKSLIDSGAKRVGIYRLDDLKPSIKGETITLYHGGEAKAVNQIKKSGLKNGSFLGVTEKESSFYSELAKKYGKDGSVIKVNVPIENIAINPKSGELMYFSK